MYLCSLSLCEVIIPTAYVLPNVLIAFAIGNYPFKDINGYGGMVLMRARKKSVWWISKCIWAVITSVVTYAILVVEVVAVALAGGRLSWQVNRDICYRVSGYDKDFDKDLIGEEYIGAWKKFNIFSLKAHNPEPTVRAYSMANYPDEGDIITLTVRIATTPFLPRPQVGFQNVPTGIASSYIFSLKPGDKVMMSGPYGDFHPNFTSGKEMIWIGGGAGMAPLRAQIMHMTKTLHTTDRELHFFYGARALGEAFFLEDFWELEKEFPNFHFHLSLDRKDPVADAQGVKYYEGFAVNCIRDTYLKDHEAPEDCEYYLCGPPMLIKTVTDYLDSLGVDPESIMYDNFG